MIVKEQPDEQRRKRPWFVSYAIGLILGLLSAAYGLYALLDGSAYLPGLRGGTATVHGKHGVGAAVIYLTGGLFLLCRFFIHQRLRSEGDRKLIYVLENALLLALIAAVFYVLLNVGTAG
ncbi:MAG: hypothetical protein J7M08_03080 [Planctomycetes bacterium]|nr:hypothetical protein [Planctomycetota bacterium]